MHLIVSLLLLFLQPSESVKSENISQANHYLEYFLSNEPAKDLHLWAFNELYYSTCQIENDTFEVLKSFQSNDLTSIYMELGCPDDDSELTRTKFQAAKKIALEYGFLSFSYYYLTYENDAVSRSEFLEEFTSAWSMSFTDRDLNNLSEFAGNRTITADTDYFLENLSYTFLVLTNEDLDVFDSEALSELLEVSLENNELEDLQKSFLKFISIKISFRIDQFSSAALIYNDENFLHEFPNSPLKMRAYNALEYSFYRIGEYDKSLSIQRNKSLPLATYFDDKYQFDNISIRQSSYLFLLGKFQEAKQILERLYNDPDTEISKAAVFNNLAICYEKLGEKNKYISLLLEALQESENRTQPNQPPVEVQYKEQLSIYRNLFIYYNSIGDSSSALNYIGRGESLATQVNDSLELAAIHFNISTYYWENYKDFDKSIYQINLAEEISTNIEDYRFSIDLLLDKSNILIQVDSLRAAQRELNDIIGITQSRSDTRNYINALTQLTEVALKLNDLQAAKDYLAEIALYPLDGLDFEEVIKYHTVTSQVLQQEGKYREALIYLKPFVAQVAERARGSIDSETGFWNTSQIFLEAYHTLVENLLELGKVKEALTYLDELKTINEANLYNSPILRASRLTEEELSRDKKLNDQIQSLRSQYLVASESERIGLKSQIDYLAAQRQTILNKVRGDEHEQNIPVWAIQQKIAPNELVIHFAQLNNSLYQSRISANNITITEIPLDDELRTLLETSANQLASGETSLTNLYRLNQFLGLLDLPKDVEQISVIPDDQLFRIPLDVLPVTPPNSSNSYGSTRYLIEDYSFKYFTSLKELGENTRSQKSNMQTGLSAFAISYFEDFEQSNLPALPYATKEVRMIEGTLTNLGSKRIFIGDNATKSSFIDQIGQSRIIHIATHSEVSEKDPLFSTIYLKSGTEESENQGQALYAYELFDSQIDNDLIMLNSCSSGSGSYMQGSGIVGISRALRSAGAKSLALNLWNVNDKIASEFAEDFYSYLNEGYTKNEAMRLSKINQLRYGNADPHYWGAYSLIGNTTPVTKKPARTTVLYSLLIGVTLLAGYRMREHPPV